MRTEIATLGEFGLIDRLTEGIKPENESTRYGVGDDAAVLSYPSGETIIGNNRLPNGRCKFRLDLCTSETFGI